METFKEYQDLTAKTAIYPKDNGISYCILGLLGEAGEIANKYKKILRDNNNILTEEKRQEIISEVGDVLWYLSQLSTELNVSLSEVAKNNITKLFDRRARNVVSGSGDNR